MEKCYISGMITGLDIIEAKKTFEQAEKFVKTIGYKPINPMKLPHNHDKKWESFMKKDITALIDCQAIYMIENWQKSKGAKLELIIAKNLGIQIIFG